MIGYLLWIVIPWLCAVIAFLGWCRVASRADERRREDDLTETQRDAMSLRELVIVQARDASRQARKCGCEMHETVASLRWVWVAQLDAIIEDDPSRLLVLLGHAEDLEAKLDKIRAQPRVTVVSEDHLRRVAGARWN